MLDAEKIKWMMNRCDSRWWEDDSWEIYQKLSQDMHSTMDFLESCTGKEISIIEDEVIDLIDEFDGERDDNVFIEFLEQLATNRSFIELKDAIAFYKTNTSDQEDFE